QGRVRCRRRGCLYRRRGGGRLLFLCFQGLLLPQNFVRGFIGTGPRAGCFDGGLESRAAGPRLFRGIIFIVARERKIARRLILLLHRGAVLLHRAALWGAGGLKRPPVTAVFFFLRRRRRMLLLAGDNRSFDVGTLRRKMRARIFNDVV